MCSLRDAAKRFAQHNTTIYGISLDSVRAQRAFKEDHGFGFGLLSDPDGSVAKKYGVLMDGRPYARRVTFIIDPKGVVRHVTKKVDLGGHGDQLLEVITELQG